MRICTKCKTEKSLNEFYKTTSHGISRLRGDCKECFEAYRKEYFKKNPNKRNEYHTKWRKTNMIIVKQKQSKYKKRNPIKIKFLNQRYWLKKTFNLSVEDYNQLLKDQKYQCAICKKKFQKLTEKNVSRLCIDHNHKTGKIRGLLCTNCNLAIGNMKENIVNLDNAITYLKRKTL